MRYVDQCIGDHESVLISTRVAWPYHVLSLAALILLGPLLIGIYIFTRMQIWIWTTEFALTDRKVILKRGLIRRQTFEVPLTSLDEVAVDQSIVGRLFKFGTVTVWGSARGELRSPPIGNPIRFRSRLSDARARLIQPDGTRPEHVRNELGEEVGRPARTYRLQDNMPAAITAWD